MNIFEAEGEALDIVAQCIYGIDRRPGETDESLRDRCEGVFRAFCVCYRLHLELNGATCVRCKEHNEYAEPSAAYVCYRCRA